MTDDDQLSNVVPHAEFALVRWRRSRDQLAGQLYSLADSINNIKLNLDIARSFLEYQHEHFQELIDRSKDVQDFCARCQEIMMDGNPEKMERERDWLIASYRKQNAHRKSWLGRLGQS